MSRRDKSMETESRLPVARSGVGRVLEGQLRGMLSLWGDGHVLGLGAFLPGQTQGLAKALPWLCCRVAPGGLSPAQAQGGTGPGQDCPWSAGADLP